MEINVEYPDFVPWWLHLAISLLIFAGMLGLWIGTSNWAARDASRRGKAGCLVGLLVLFTWPIGLLFWLIARPDLRSNPSVPPPLPRQ